MPLKMSSAKWRPIVLCLNVLKGQIIPCISLAACCQHEIFIYKKPLNPWRIGMAAYFGREVRVQCVPSLRLDTAIAVWSPHRIKMVRHENAFRITVPLWGESASDCKVPFMWKFEVFFVASLDELLNRVANDFRHRDAFSHVTTLQYDGRNTSMCHGNVIYNTNLYTGKMMLSQVTWQPSQPMTDGVTRGVFAYWLRPLPPDTRWYITIRPRLYEHLLNSSLLHRCTDCQLYFVKWLGTLRENRERTGLCNPVLSVSANDFSFDKKNQPIKLCLFRPGIKLFSISTRWLQQAYWTLIGASFKYDIEI